MSKVSAAKKQHRSMRGKNVDMDLLRKRNELTPAVGNAKINARGDELGPGGAIIKKREDVVSEHYATANVENQRQPVEDVIEYEEPVKEPVKKAAKTTKKSAAPAEVAAEEAALDAEEEWIEDEDGNFVKKGE
tara:strand:+ start:61 stop:459 length:399 start_codon:yes stop_codon:yes gene_type:complete